jgi:hypothetical protein
MRFGKVGHYGKCFTLIKTCKWSVYRQFRATETDYSAYVTDLIWLSTSSAVDLILSIVLSLELWWARRKLAARGGIMAKVTWQLLASFLVDYVDWGID